MRSRFGQNIGRVIRAAAAVAVLALVGFMIGAPLGCGHAETGDTGTTPSSVSANSDAVPVGEIVWDGDVSPASWPAITNLKSVDIENPNSSAPTICWHWTDPKWPYKDGKSEGNNWIIVKISGVWHATPWEHLPRGNDVCRTTEANGGQPPFIQGYGPIASWRPKIGEAVGFMNSTIARGSQAGYTNPKERTYIYMTKWQ